MLTMAPRSMLVVALAAAVRHVLLTKLHDDMRSLMST
jgi:hypothetical protein